MLKKIRGLDRSVLIFGACFLVSMVCCAYILSCNDAELSKRFDFVVYSFCLVLASIVTQVGVIAVEFWKWLRT